MSFKPVILVYDIDNRMVDEVATELGSTGLYTTINTYNEANALDALHQYDRAFGLLTNKLACVVTGWNHHLTLREQFLFRLRKIESRSPLRRATPAIIVTEDHRDDLKSRALGPEGRACAYLQRESFVDELRETVHAVVYENRADELNQKALAAFQSSVPAAHGQS